MNGPLYCFDRASGQRRWFYDDLLENQMLVLEQFADLPVVIAAAPQMDRNGVASYRVVIIEKDRGRLVYNGGMTGNVNQFQNMTVDPKNGTIDLHRFDTRIHIFRDDATAVAGK